MHQLSWIRDPKPILSRHIKSNCKRPQTNTFPAYQVQLQETPNQYFPGISSPTARDPKPILSRHIKSNCQRPQTNTFPAYQVQLPETPNQHFPGISSPTARDPKPILSWHIKSNCQSHYGIEFRSIDWLSWRHTRKIYRASLTAAKEHLFSAKKPRAPWQQRRDNLVRRIIAFNGPQRPIWPLAFVHGDPFLENK